MKAFKPFLIQSVVCSSAIVSLIAFGALLALGTHAAFALDVAKVNGRSITDRDVNTALSGFNEAQRSNLLKDPNSRRQVVINLVDQEVLVQEGEKIKLDQDAEVLAAVAAFKKQLVANKLLERNLASKITEKTARKFYDSRKREYSTDQVQVMHILVNDEATALDLKKRARNPGEDFQNLAEKHSKDPSAKNNRGDLGFIDRASPLVKEFKDAAFSGAEGEVVGPVRSVYGYHVIKIAKKKLGKPLEFAEVEQKVRVDLKQELIQDYVAQLKKKSKVQLDDKAIGKL